MKSEFLLCATFFLISPAVVAASVNNTYQPPPGLTLCQECKITMDGAVTFLRKGEKMQDPNDPCETYVCLQNLQLQKQIVDCRNIDQCGDGKAPYKLPGACCDTCEFHESIRENYNLNVTAAEQRTKVDSWKEWGHWTECSRECGGGRQSRMRDCDLKSELFVNCSGERIQIRECNTHNCPVHGGWTQWTEWTDCSQTCGNGSQSRNRSCTNPAPMYGGTDCAGEERQGRQCFLRHCPVDCDWGAWSNWTECNKECGGGTEYRERVKSQVEKYGGRPCDGLSVDSQSCNTHFCPIDGGLTEWSEWSNCSEWCGNGRQNRSRSCTNPPPQYGGKNCDEELSESRECFIRHCPVHCKWLEFSEWSACSLSCDSGIKSRVRGFEPAQHGGDDCTGDTIEVEPCNTQPCPDPCRDGVFPCYINQITNQNVTCQKLTDTTFECGECPRGMRGDGRGKTGCQYVDECEEASPCFPGALCQDLLEGYECGSCPPGYRGSRLRGYDLTDAHTIKQICEDINECTEIPNGGCTEIRECENLMGSFACGPCPPGYIEDGPLNCQFSDPCAAGIHNCQELEYCINHAVGQFHCHCPEPLIGNGRECSNDTDLDGVADTLLTIGCDQPNPCLVDNCPNVPNSGQEDNDNDGIGNACDDDADNDGIKDDNDNCMYLFNPGQRDRDYDGFGNECDNCQIIPNRDQKDTDWDGIGDSCDSDRDGDGIINSVDNCPLHYNPTQVDSDRDRWGDSCDNCLAVNNYKQSDVDQDGVGDSCEDKVDKDKDGIQDNMDNCLKYSNADQLDTDGDGKGNPCDNDDDGDEIEDKSDNCPLVNNPGQKDENGDGIGDACQMDTSGDGIFDAMDTDGDKVADLVDNNPTDKLMYRTDFTRNMKVSLSNGDYQIVPEWRVFGNGTEVRQNLNSNPGLLIGYDSFSNVEYTGTLYVDTTYDDDYVGFVFNYQSNRRFMLVSWKQNSQQHWEKDSKAFAEAGIQIHRINSKTGPGPALTSAVWHSGHTKKQTRMLYHDPLKVGWSDKKAYRWNLQYSSKAAYMRLRIYDESGKIVDTNCVSEKQIKGGRLGLYVFSQEKVIFSNLRYRSLYPQEESSLVQCNAQP